MCGPTNPPCRSLSHTHNPIRIDDVLFSLSQTGCIIRSTAAHCCQNGHHKSSGQNKASDSCLHFQYNIRQKIQNFTVPKTDDTGCGQYGQPCPPHALRLRKWKQGHLPLHRILHTRKYMIFFYNFCFRHNFAEAYRIFA